MTYYEGRVLDVLGNVAVIDDCWIWLGAATVPGYGVMSVHHKSMGVHKFMYQQLVGPVPAGLHLDHLCRNPRCCKPAHLEPVTPHENVVVRGFGPAAKNSRLTHCKNGHPFSGDNLYVCLYRNGKLKQRRCKVCERSFRLKREARKRAEVVNA